MPYMPDHMHFKTFGHKVIGGQSYVESGLNGLKKASTWIFRYLYVVDIQYYRFKLDIREFGDIILKYLFILPTTKD